MFINLTDYVLILAYLPSECVVQGKFSPVLCLLKLQYMGNNWLLSNYTPHSTQLSAQCL